MIGSFRVHKINWSTRKLTRIPILIKKKNWKPPLKDWKYFIKKKKKRYYVIQH